MLPIRIPSKTSIRSEKSTVSSKQVSSKKTTFKNKNFLKKRNDLCIIYNDDEVTPKLLLPVELSGKFDLLSFSQLEIRSHYELSVFGNLSATVLHTNMHTQSIAAASQISYTSILNRDDFCDSYTYDATSDYETSSIDECNYEQPYIMPTKINIVLTETPVLYLLELTSTTEVKGSEEGDLIEKDNEHYDYLTVGKGRNRKTTNAEIQTAMSLLKTRSTNANRPKRNSDYAFASKWDMHDTYGDIGETDEKIINITPIKPKYHQEIKADDDLEKDSLEQQMKDLLNNPKFQLSVLVMERVLANNIFNQQQKRFRGLIEQDPFRPDIEFRYNLDLLWTFKNPYVEGHPVTAMQWHPINNDILAVGYGKYLYTDKKPGLIYCWNVKNPTQPEREFSFIEPVSSLSFSRYEPNLLAVGLYDGTIAMLDIAKKNVTLLMMTKKNLILSYEPIWQMEWFPPDGYNINDNHVISVCEDGRVSSIASTKTNDLIQIETLRTFNTESKLRGVYQPKQCAASEIPVCKESAALTITKHSTEEGIYYVGTSDGTVHKCSENYQNQHIDIFIAHAGPVFGLQFSHFCSKLFLTCGADSCINIWSEHIKEPLATLTKSLLPIEGAEWCPANSTIIANICGNFIYLWDLQRKTYMPASEHCNPNNCRNTVIKFSHSGRNLVVGDIEGNVHVFTLSDIPFPPFYQASMLEQVMYKNLVTRQDLILKIKETRLCDTKHDMKMF